MLTCSFENNEPMGSEPTNLVYYICYLINVIRFELRKFVVNLFFSLDFIILLFNEEYT